MEAMLNIRSVICSRTGAPGGDQDHTVQVSSLVGVIIVFHKHISVEVFEVSFILPVSETVSMISHTFEESRPIQARVDPE